MRKLEKRWNDNFQMAAIINCTQFMFRQFRYDRTKDEHAAHFDIQFYFKRRQNVNKFNCCNVECSPTNMCTMNAMAQNGFSEATIKRLYRKNKSINRNRNVHFSPISNYVKYHLFCMIENEWEMSGIHDIDSVLLL